MDLRTQILNAKDSAEEELELPQWGGVKVLVVNMNGTSRAEFIRDCVRKDGTLDVPKAYPQLVIRCTLDPATREPIFTQADRDALMEKNGSPVEKIAELALRVNGLTDVAREEMAKNLPPGANGGSSSI